MQINKLEFPQKTYFYERPDGSVIEARAVEAWKLHKKLKQIGVSDGRKFHEAVRQAHELYNQSSDGDKARELLRKGREEEIEAARGHFEVPPNPDVIEPTGPTGFRPRR